MPYASHVGFLTARRTEYSNLTLLPVHFILMGSNQQQVQYVTGYSGPLFRRVNIGVPHAVYVPPPPLQLLAGMMRQYHPQAYPQDLLRAVATSGRYLDCFLVQPVTPLELLSLRNLNSHTLLHPNDLEAVIEVITNHGNTKKLRISDKPLRMGPINCFDASPFDYSQLDLAEPQLVTAAVLMRAGVFNFYTSAINNHIGAEELEEEVQVAEGYAMEVLLRKDLVDPLVSHLGLQGE
jgi:hypothetical protein